MKYIIFPQLPQGRENAISMEDLASRMSIPARTLRAYIARELEAGALILSTSNRPAGYYRPAEGDKGLKEIAECYKSRRARAARELARLAPLEIALRNTPGQTEIDPQQPAPLAL